MSVRAVSDALKHLRELGLLHRIRRCVEDWQDGRFRLRQETNAYVLLAERDLLAGLEATSRAASARTGHLGGFPPPPLLTGVALAALETDPVAKVAALRLDVRPPHRLRARLPRRGDPGWASSEVKRELEFGLASSRPEPR